MKLKPWAWVAGAAGLFCVFVLAIVAAGEINFRRNESRLTESIAEASKAYEKIGGGYAEEGAKVDKVMNRLLMSAYPDAGITEGMTKAETGERIIDFQTKRGDYRPRATP